MSNGISDVLTQLAEAATRHEQEEKQAFVPMPGGEAAPPPTDPAMAGGMPPAAGGMPADPMAMAAGGADPAAIMAAQGAPVDPMMAAAGGAGPMPAAPPPPAEAAPAAAPTKGGGQKEKLDEIHTMLSKILGVLVGKGLLQPDELGGVLGQETAQAQAGAVQPPEGGIPAEEKIAEDSEPESVGSVAKDGNEDVVIPAKRASEVKNALAGLISSLGG